MSACWAALWLTPSWLASAVTIACWGHAVKRPGLARRGLVAATADLLAVADGTGLPDDAMELDARAAAGTAIAASGSRDSGNDETTAAD